MAFSLFSSKKFKNSPKPPPHCLRPLIISPKIQNTYTRLDTHTNMLALITRIQSAKILLLPPKYEIIMLPSNHSFFQYCDSNIGLFLIAPCKVFTPKLLCIFFDGFLSKVIALPTIAIAIVVALSRS